MGTARMDVQAVLAEAPQAPAKVYSAPMETRIGHVHLSVGDLADAGQILSGGIGMKKKASYPQADFYASGDYHHHIAANTWHLGEQKTYAQGFAGLERVTLRALNLTDGQKLSERLLNEGGKQGEKRVEFAGPSGIPFALDLRPH
jgi:catechol 2,3-dioxygenase